MGGGGGVRHAQDTPCSRGGTTSFEVLFNVGHLILSYTEQGGGGVEDAKSVHPFKGHERFYRLWGGGGGKQFLACDFPIM